MAKNKTSFRKGDNPHINPWDFVQVGNDGNLVGMLDEDGVMITTLTDKLAKKASMAEGDTGRRKTFPAAYITPKQSPNKRYR